MNADIILNEDALLGLRQELSSVMSEKRYIHTLEVEKMAHKLGAFYLPDKLLELRAAALLHDITKELSKEEHILICKENGVEVTEEMICAPKTFHALTAALIIPKRYPWISDGEIVRAVRYHTTGRADMTIFEKIIYLADYIDMSRKFDDCVKLREYFFSRPVEKMGEEEALRHLDDTLIMSFDMTLRGLIDEGKPISTDSVRARDFLIIQRIKNS